MSKLRAPLKRVFDEPLSELELQRMWRKLQVRAAAPVGLPHSAVRRLAWPLLAAACLSLLGLVAYATPWLPLAFSPAPLTLTGNARLSSRQSFGGQHGVHLSLSDGSQVRLSDDAVLSVTDNSGPSFGTRIERGRAEFEVKPGGRRRWRVECGSVRVEVVGTRFSVERGERGVLVQVTRGVVAVHGETIPGGDRRLGAGDELYVATGVASTAATRPAAVALAKLQPSAADHQPQPSAANYQPQPTASNYPPPPLAAGASSGPRAEPEPAARVAPRTWPKTVPGAKPLATRARSSGPEGLDAQLSSLLRAADAARRARDFERARNLLEQVMRLSPAGQYAAVAGITLGRMQMQAQPDRAAEALRAALAATPPAGLREDIMARLVEAHVRAGHVELARAAAAAYEQAFPRGRRLAEVRHWIAPP